MQAVQAPVMAKCQACFTSYCAFRDTRRNPDK